jgi:leucyl aminopeptidase
MSPKLNVIDDSLEKVQDQCVVLPFFENNLTLNSEISKLDSGFEKIISNAIDNKDFKAEEKEIKLIYTNNKDLRYIALLGLGKENKFTLEKLMDAFGALTKKMRSSDISSFSISVEPLKSENYSEELSLDKAVKSIILASYQFLKFKTKDLDKVKKIEKVSLIVKNGSLNASKKIVEDSIIYAEAVNKTRDLINTPPNIANPEYIADYAKAVAEKNSLKCTVLDEKQLTELGMECFMAVAQGSANKPRMVILEYNGNGNDKPIALVGKGITFDSGGLNLKPSSYLAHMKDDKGGACGVIHILESCAKLNLKVNVVGICALAENMISSNSYRPDDVLKSYSGITVEITNTDAEGRLVLADSLAYSLKYKPKAIIDIATLTGASIVALGYFASPYVGNNDELLERVKKASLSSLEKTWPLPLWEEYEGLIKSDIADVRHHSDESSAGVIEGGIFLKNFIKDVPWVHLDIGNTVWAKQEGSYTAKGATGFSVLLLLNLLKDWK